MMRKYRISTANSKSSTSWKKEEVSWEDFLTRLRFPDVGKETQDEYLRMKKSEQDLLKDKGGFVAGTFAGHRRKKSDLEKRTMITLDLDNIEPYKTESVLEKVKGLGCLAAVYSTRKHRPEAPRLRIIIPMSRETSIEEHEAVARKVASIIGIGQCDMTTFEGNRLMFWPSYSKGAEYIFRDFTGPELSVENVLSMYGDWRNVYEWPVCPGEDDKILNEAKRQGNPLEKTGVVGFFCRTYSIYEVIEEYLSDVYAPTDDDDRYTYIKGSTSAGAWIVENGLFLKSFHSTDPANNGHIANAFDLVRIHKFGALDDNVKEGTPANKMPSFTEMSHLVLKDRKVLVQRAKDEAEGDKEAFPPMVPTGGKYLTKAEIRVELDRSKSTGEVIPTMKTLRTIIREDVNLKGKLWYDVFCDRVRLNLPVPWREGEDGMCDWGEVDDVELYSFIEKEFDLQNINKSKLVDAVLAEAYRNKRNPVEEFLMAQQWDGVHRLDNLFVDYLGAEPCEYVRAVTRKTFVAAVARAISNVGVKFDTMPITYGGQGIGKSTLFRKMGMLWYSDSLTSFEGKDAVEALVGVWIMEIGELTAMGKQESNTIKQYLSKTEDRYRPAYGRRTETHPRRCVFIGTSNDIEFLKDTTGNRRFWPVCVSGDSRLSPFYDLPEETVRQIWAEAVIYYRLGEPLFLSPKLSKEAEKRQMENMVTTGKEGLVGEFLDREIPGTWYKMRHEERMQFLNGNLKLPEDVKLVKRDRVCAMEIWQYCYMRQPGMMKPSDAREIMSIVSVLPGWKRHGKNMRFGNLGVTKGCVAE